MKKSLFVIMCLIFSVFATNAQENTDKPNQKGKGAYIQFDKSLDHSNGVITYDYGKIAKMSSGECVFSFKNTGKTPLILTDVTASCGCTTPTWPKNTPIMPGKTGEIYVKYNTTRMGPFNKSIKVTSNAENNFVELRVKGEVVEQVNEALPLKPAQNQGSPINRN